MLGSKPDGRHVTAESESVSIGKCRSDRMMLEVSHRDPFDLRWRFDWGENETVIN
jgi:hypothetical protein